VADRCTELTGLLDGAPAGFSPFTGALRICHALWFGSSLLPGAGHFADVTLTLGYRCSRPASEVAAFFGAMTFEYLSGGAAAAVASQVSQPAAGTVALRLAVGAVDQQSAFGPGLADPVTSQWLRTALAAPLPLSHVAQDLTIGSAAIRVIRNGLLPDAVLAGQATADPSKDFQPFGPSPQVGDACCIGSDEAFGKRGAEVKIVFTASTGNAKNVSLVWEYLGPGGWAPLPVQTPAGYGLTTDGTVTIDNLPDIPPASIGGQLSRWIRVRIAGGGYGTAVQWSVTGTTLTPTSGTGDLDPPRLSSVSLSYMAQATPAVLRQSDATFSDQSAAAATGTPFPAFVPVTAIEPGHLADPDPAFYLGLDAVAAGCPMSLYVAPAPRAISGRVITQPRAGTRAGSVPGPLAWEYFDGTGWQPLPVLDGTSGLSVPGSIVVLTPPDMTPLARFGPDARYWIRARAPRTSLADERLLTGIYLNTVRAQQATAVAGEVAGSGNGQGGQVFWLAQPPVLRGQQIWVAEPEWPSAAEQRQIAAAEGQDAVTTVADPVTGQPQVWVRWHEVANFVCSGPADRHYTVDHASGAVTFGDGTRGLIPPAGAANVSASYLTGGGPAGNVPAGAITQLLSPVPAVQAVTNPLPADGGAPGETVGQVRDRGPQEVRNRDRAVAAGDFEWLARQAAGTRVARAICLPNVNDRQGFEPGWVTLVLVPRSDAQKPSPGVELISLVEGYLRARACADLVLPAPVKINVTGPGYVRVTVVATIVPRDITQAVTVKQQVAAALSRYLHPLTGGLAGDGWVSGRAVWVSEVASVIERTPGVSYATSLRLMPSAVQRRLTLQGAAAAIAAPAGSLLVSRDRRKACLLAEPVQAGTVASSLTVTGPRECDVVTNLLDLTLSQPAVPGSPAVSAVPAPWPVPAGFPAGTAVIGPGGRRTSLAGAVLIHGAGPVPPPVQVEFTDQEFTDGLAAGSVITLVGQFPFTITSVSPGQDRGQAGPAGRIDITTAPAAGDVTYPAGTVIGTLDGRLRLPLAQPAAPDPATGTISTAVLADLEPGEQIQVPTADGTGMALTATLAGLEPVYDVVYLDPDVFPYATEHHLDMIGP
jgi:predicted phage baseplate assembly protein